VPNPETKYDVVIIGSGMGGLACGLFLAKEGKKVCILEKEAQIGGTLQTFKRDKVKFDTGVHYIGGLDAGQPLHPYFKYLDILDNVELLKMNPDGYDRISFAGDSNFYPHAQGYSNFKNQLLEYFPDEEIALDKYLDEIKNVCSKFSLYNISGGNQKYSELDYMYASAKKFIESCTDNVLLQQVLAGSNLLYAGEGEKSPFYVHALIVNSYILSSYKIKDGGSRISRSLNYSIKELGGKILRNAEVVEICQANKQVEHVLLKDGQKIKGDVFISNAAPQKTLELLDHSGLRKSYVNRIMNQSNSISVFSLYIVLQPNTVKYFDHNHYHFSKNEVWELTNYKAEDWGKDIAIFTMPSKNNPEYAGIITVLAYMNFDEVIPWEESFRTTLQNNDREKTYEAFKEKKAQILFKQLEKVIPGVGQHVSAYYTSTPLTQRDYLNTVDGSLYGVVKDFNSPLKSMINTKTKFSNLFLTGQNIIMHGILGATIGAVVTCGEIIGRDYLISKIKDKI